MIFHFCYNIALSSPVQAVGDVGWIGGLKLDNALHWVWLVTRALRAELLVCPSSEFVHRGEPSLGLICIVRVDQIQVAVENLFASLRLHVRIVDLTEFSLVLPRTLR